MALGDIGLGELGSRDITANAPDFDLFVMDSGGKDVRVTEGVRQRIMSVTYESSDGIADMMRVIIADPANDQGVFEIRESKLFQPGNELSLFGGYGGALTHLGRAIIRRSRATYPQEGIPTVEAVAYTKDVFMMDNAPVASSKLTEEPLVETTSNSKLLKKIQSTKLGRPRGRIHKNEIYSDAVIDVAEGYGFELDVDPTHDEPHDFIQKAGLTDYDFVQGMSNMTGFFFWVDGDQEGKWTLHFRDPDTDVRASIQDKKFTFKYNQGNLSTLLNFEPELAIQGAITKLKVQVKEVLTGRLLIAEIEEENQQSPEVLVAAGIPGDELNWPDQSLEGEHTTGPDIKLIVGDFSFEVRSNRKFKTAVELGEWARQWFKRNRENFVLGRGSLVGVETIMARQSHFLEGLGIGLDGEYNFTTVTHSFSADNGYVLDFSGRKIVTKVAPIINKALPPLSDEEVAAALAASQL